MLVDIFNSFEPVRFLIDSPLWFSFFAPGVALALILSAGYIAMKLTVRDTKELREVSIPLGIIVSVIWMFGMPLSLLEVFTRAGIAGGYPQVLAMFVGVTLNILTVFVIVRTVLTLSRFTSAHPKPQKPVKNSGEDM